MIPPFSQILFVFELRTKRFRFKDKFRREESFVLKRGRGGVNVFAGLEVFMEGEIIEFNCFYFVSQSLQVINYVPDALGDF